MKKIVITIAAVVFAAVATQAQSIQAEVAIMNTGFSAFAPKKNVSAQTRKDTAKKANLQNKVTRKVERAEAQNAQKQKEAAKPAKKAPAKKPAAKSTTKKTSGKAKIAKQSNVGDWLKAAFLGAPYPGETASDYHNRLAMQSQPAALPFK